MKGLRRVERGKENSRVRLILLFFEEKERETVLAILALVLVSGFIYSFMRGNNLPYLDEREYLVMASSLTKGLYSLDGTNPTAFKPPGYPFFLAFFRLFSFDVILLRFLNFLLLGGSILLLYLILKQSVSRRAGIVGMFVILYYPVLFYTAGTLYPQTLGSFLMLSFIYLLFGNTALSLTRAILAAVSMGSLILVIPTFLFVLVLSVLYLVLRRKSLKVSAILLIVTGLMVGMWMWRNYHVFNVFPLVTTNSGLNLFLGNFENATPNSGLNADSMKYREKSWQMDEVRQDQYFRSEAVKFMTENKYRTLKLYFLKVLNYFNYTNELATKTEASIGKDLLMLVTYGPLMILFVARILFLKRFPLKEIEKYFISIYVANAFFQAIFFTRVRFRLPFDFLLIGVVSVFVTNLLTMFAGKGKSSMPDGDTNPNHAAELFSATHGMNERV